jgi:hypothetical protein
MLNNVSFSPSEILAYLSSAYSITRKAQYREAFYALVNDHGYVKNLMNVKIDNPGNERKIGCL